MMRYSAGLGVPKTPLQNIDAALMFPGSRQPSAHQKVGDDSLKWGLSGDSRTHISTV